MLLASKFAINKNHNFCKENDNKKLLVWLTNDIVGCYAKTETAKW